MNHFMVASTQLGCSLRPSYHGALPLGCTLLSLSLICKDNETYPVGGLSVMCSDTSSKP